MIDVEIDLINIKNNIFKINEKSKFGEIMRYHMECELDEQILELERIIDELNKSE